MTAMAYSSVIASLDGRTGHSVTRVDGEGKDEPEQAGAPDR